jgi:hypothetical protein
MSLESLCLASLSPHRLTARTSDFQSENTGAAPVAVTIFYQRLDGASEPLGLQPRCGGRNTRRPLQFHHLMAPVAQWTRAAGFEPVGRGFKSCQERHFTP